MAKEIERKFLLRSDIPTNTILEGGTRIVQGFLSKDPLVRVRLRGRHLAYLTIKGPGTLVRDEFEYEIPRGDGEQLIKMCPKTIIKVRHQFSYEGRVWALDSFQGSLDGFRMAEVEIESQFATVEIPPWLGPEVTGDPRYSNVRLIDDGVPLV
jgi:adenylate cyclase